MFNKNIFLKAVQFTLLSGAAISSVSFAAQAAGNETQAEVERIEVTGSRIRRSQMEGANPVQLLGKLEIEKMGLSSIGEALQTLTASAGDASNTQNNNGSDGATRFSLRGMVSKEH
ncbi:Plug domain-containing protein [Pseudoalteromonas sp. NBT06-2]|uniref:Plug domain-containing protein n=1 Tax=Pseudoalteromonas sp. NBT06-2 TaxID=2025950 RepID=UPI002074DAEE|nr:Plug domain-containing protein [Pseudoalteromonas sp. NBT06-2]